MALTGIAPPTRLRGLPEAIQRQFDEFYAWILRLRLGEDDSDSTTIINIAQERFIFDRFIGGNLSATGNNTDANVGELQWNTAFASNAGTVARVASIADHMGIVRVSGAAALGGHQAMYLGHAAVSGSMIALEEVEYFEFTVRNVGTGRFRFGIGNDAAAAGLGTLTIGVSADTDVNSVWYCFTNNTGGGGGATTVNTTIASAAGPWITWRITLVSSTEVEFSADGVVVANITTNVPSFSSLMAPAVQAITITPGPFQGIGEIDTFTLLRREAA